MMLSVFQACRPVVVFFLPLCLHVVLCQSPAAEDLNEASCQTVGFEMKALISPIVAKTEVVTDDFDCSDTCASEVRKLREQLGKRQYFGFSMLKGRKWGKRMGKFALDECLFALRYCVQSWEEFVSAVHAHANCPAVVNPQGTEGCREFHCDRGQPTHQPDCILKTVIEAGLPIRKCLCSSLVIVPKVKRIVPTGYPMPTQGPDAAEFCSHSEIRKRLSDRFAIMSSNWWCHRSAAIVEREACSLRWRVLKACPCVVNVEMENLRITAISKGQIKQDTDQCKNWSRSPNAMALLLARPSTAAARVEVIDLSADPFADETQKWPTASESNAQQHKSWQEIDIDSLERTFLQTYFPGAFSNHKFPERGHSSGALTIGAKRIRETSSSAELSAIQMLGEALDLHLQGQGQGNPLDISSTDYDGQIGCSEPRAIFTEMSSVSTGVAVDIDEIDALIKSTSNFIDELPEMLNDEFIIGSDAFHPDATQCSINDVSTQSAEISRKRKQKQLEQGESSADASQSFRSNLAAGVHLANVADLDSGSSQQQTARDVSSQISFAMTANRQLVNVDLGSLTSANPTSTDEPAVFNEEDIEQFSDSIRDPFPPWL